MAPVQPGGQRLGKVLCRKPENIVSLLGMCIDHGNQATTSILLSDLKVKHTLCAVRFMFCGLFPLLMLIVYAFFY